MFEAYQLPHACESAEIAGLLAELSPKQRRVLRAYVWQVELGDRSVTAWLDDPKCPVSRSAWYEGGARGRYWTADRFQRALAAYLRAGLAWMMDQERREIGRAQSKIRRAAPGAADRLVEQAQADIGQLFKTVERWTGLPLDADEVLEERVEQDDKGHDMRRYRVRRTVIDTSRLADPRYSRLVKKYAESARGMSIELYDAQHAAESVLDRADLDTASKAAAGAGTVVVLPDNGREIASSQKDAPRNDGVDAGGPQYSGTYSGGSDGSDR